MPRRTLPLVGLLVILLSGCFKIDFKITVEDDGSGSIEGLLAIDANAAADLASVFGEIEGAETPSREELCNDFLDDSEVPEGASTEPYDEGDFCGVRFSQSFTAAEMDQVLTESFQDEGGEFVIARDGDGWRFDATIADEATEGADFFPQELLGDSEFVIRVKLPGRQVEHNADRIESDGTLVWDLDLFNPGPPLMARTEPGTPITGSGGDGGGSNTVLIVVLVLVVLALAAGGLWWWRKKSAAPAAAVAGEPGPGGPPSADVGAPVTPPPVAPPPVAPPLADPPPESPPPPPPPPA